MMPEKSDDVFPFGQLFISSSKDRIRSARSLSAGRPGASDIRGSRRKKSAEQANAGPVVKVANASASSIMTRRSPTTQYSAAAEPASLKYCAPLGSGPLD